MHAMLRHLWHAVDQVLAQPAATNKERPEAISISRYKKETEVGRLARPCLAGWSTRHDTTNPRASPSPEARANQAAGRPMPSPMHHTEVHERAPGKLQFMAAATLGNQGLFGALQLALNNSTRGRIPVNREPKDHLCAFARLAANVGRRPTHLAEIVPQDPSHLGAGGLPNRGPIQACLGRQPSRCHHKQ